MVRLEKNKGRYVFRVFFICAAALFLGIAVNFMHSRILAQAGPEDDTTLKEVFPEAVRFEPVKSAGNTLYYKAFGPDGLLAGAVFKAAQHGYSSVIESLVGMKKDGTITAIKILSQNESPGVGARVEEPAFTGQFTNKNIQQLNGVEAIAGATISSRAVIESVKKQAEEILALIKREGL